jgi:hypothetical protein
MGTVAPMEKPFEPAMSDDLQATLYPPKLVMDHQSELGIDDAQKAAILKELRTTQAELVELDWRLRGDKEKLTSALSSARVNEEEALSVAKGVMRIENQVKTAHLAMLIRIKNTLTEGQQSQLDEIRSQTE